jgi:hypothetical protein
MYVARPSANGTDTKCVSKSLVGGLVGGGSSVDLIYGLYWCILIYTHNAEYVWST